MLVLLDATILTNFARVGLTSAPLHLWGDQVHTTVEALNEYDPGTKTAGLPPLAWKRLGCLVLTQEEQVLVTETFRSLGKGESTCLAVAVVRGAILATDDKLARRAAKAHGIQYVGTVGILRSCIQRGILSQTKAQKALEGMIEAGYYSTILNLEDK